MVPSNDVVVADKSDSAAADDTARAAADMATADDAALVAADKSDSAATDDAALVAGWHDLLDRHARATWALERALQLEHGLGVSEFEVLERLAGCDNNKLRMQELAKAVHLSQSALSRVVGRLEDEDLVTRGICAEDRRGIYACVTDAGRTRYEAARPTHRRVLAAVL